jgi:hypothetical protein
MKPRTNRRNIVRFSFLWALLVAAGSAMAVLPEVDDQNKGENRLYWLAEDHQQQNQEGSVSVKISHDLIFSPDSPLRSANQKPVEVKFNLPGLGQTIATINEYNFINQKEYSHIGQIQGEVGGKLFLTVANQTFLGLAVLNNGRKYYITKKPGHPYSVKEKIKPSLPFRCETCEVDRHSPIRKIQKLSKPAGSEASPKHHSLLGGTVIVDVLAIYTKKARKIVGGSNHDHTNDDHIKNLYQTYINIANTALKDSGVDVKFNVVHKEEIAYEELEEEDAILDAFDRFRDESDELSKEIAGLKKQYKPDLVSLVVSTQFGKRWDVLKSGGFTRGRANMPVSLSEKLLYSVINVAAEENVFLEMGDYVLAHELGHNFGCHHDRDNAKSGKPIYDYGYGYRFQVIGPRGDKVDVNTVMCYQRGYTDYRRGYFSNPDIEYLDVPTGVKEGQSDSANNAKVIRQVAPHISKINGGYGAPSPVPDKIQINAVSKTDSLFTISFESKSGSTYIIEVTQDLNNWSKLGEVKGTSGEVKFTDSRLPKVPYKRNYFRVKLVE